jgi:hypothetical protein
MSGMTPTHRITLGAPHGLIGLALALASWPVPGAAAGRRLHRGLRKGWEAYFSA